MLKRIVALLLLAVVLPCLTLAEEALRVVSLSPSITEVVVDLGAAELLIGVDSYSAEIAGLPEGVTIAGDMMNFDVELLVALAPDLVLVSTISSLNEFDPLVVLGIEVAMIPSSESLAAIYEDNLSIGRLLGLEQEAEALNEGMREALERVRVLGETVETPKTVYFEISAAPYLYSFGSGVFLNELIELAGAVNIFGTQESWLNISEEAVLAANPDVILTSVHYLDDPVAEIMGRPGWEGIMAVAEGAVYQVDEDTTGRANHRVALALEEMARAIYPELYE